MLLPGAESVRALRLRWSGNRKGTARLKLGKFQAQSRWGLAASCESKPGQSLLSSGHTANEYEVGWRALGAKDAGLGANCEGDIESSFLLHNTTQYYLSKTQYYLSCLLPSQELPSESLSCWALLLG